MAHNPAAGTRSRRSARHRRRAINPSDFDALLLDVDGVVTRTAVVHAAAWKRLFDEYLEARAAREGTRFEPFDIPRDYRAYLDGKPRYDGVKSFLDSRGISLTYGTPEDSSDEETICGLGNRKNEYFRRLLRDGVNVFPSTIDLVREAKARGLAVAVVSSSKNCAAVLEAAGLPDLFDARVDGVEIVRLGLRGKPAPDMFLEAARRLGVEPARAVVFEDAVSGVQAGRDGGFGLVVGVDRAGHAAALKEHGADVVVADLGEIRIEPSREATGASATAVPHALDRLEEIDRCMDGKRVAVFLDYDGTLTPIVDRPDLAVMSEEMRTTVRALARWCTVAVVSGRDRADVERMVAVDSLIYAGSHGFDIAGPDGRSMQHPEGARYLPALRQAEDELRRDLAGIDGALVEGKKYAVAVHYRLVGKEHLPALRRVVNGVASRHPGLRKTGGKKIYELRPRLAWDKGKAVLWLLEALGLDASDVLSFYLGDDETDEDAFAALSDRGIGILVASRPQATAAHYLLRNPDEVKAFLQHLITRLGEAGA